VGILLMRLPLSLKNAFNLIQKQSNFHMNKQIKKQWVEALRSEEYKQGQECLHNPSDNTFCCLGVLCDLYVKDHPDITWEESLECNGLNDTLNGGYLIREFDGGRLINGYMGYLPNEVVKWAEIKEPVEVFGDVIVKRYNGEHVSLTELNDIGVPFTLISEYIEHNMIHQEDEDEDEDLQEDSLEDNDEQSLEYFNRYIAGDR